MKVARPIRLDVVDRGHRIQAMHMGPDLICEVDGSDIGHFYLTTEAAYKAAVRHIDQLEKEQAKNGR